MKTLSAKLATEFIGTFALVFAVVGCVGSGNVLAPLGIAATLLVVVYAGGHISGAHYNPAVSTAILVRGRISFGDFAAYVLVQLIAAAAAALAAHWVFDYPEASLSTWTGHQLAAAITVETLFTFLLAFVILNVATSKDHPDNSFYGLAIAGTVAAGIAVVGPISGAAFNPAVALGVSLGELSAWENLWAYVVAQLVGGLIAGIVFKALNADDR